jgi:RNA polymerase sigma-B factor
MYAHDAMRVHGSLRGEERELFERYRRGHERPLRDALVVRFLPLVRHLASRYHYTSEPFDDLMQAGSIGLLKAIERYDPERGAAFASFAVPTISGEIKRHFRDRTWSVKVPRNVRDLIPLIQTTEIALTRTLLRPPTTIELAEELGLGVEAVLEARAAATARWQESLDQLRGDVEDHRPAGERVGFDEPGFGVAEDAAMLARLLAHLDAQDREVLRLYFVEDLTQTQVAARVGGTQMQVSRLIRRAIAQIRAVARAEEVA